MTTRALVLGGGGPVGIGWEAGMVRGLADADIDLTQADLIVGTSAGAVVGAKLALGVPPADLYEAEIARFDAREHSSNFTLDIETLVEVGKLWIGGAKVTQRVRVEIGALALKAKTLDEQDWTDSFEKNFDSAAWPERPLIVTGVDIASGEQVLWDRTSGVALSLAIAASCSVPGVLPPVAVDGRRFMDGGVRSVSNADLAQGYDRVVVLAPSGSADTPYDVNTRTQLEAEVAALRAQGSRVAYELPDAEAVAAAGPNRMDPAALMPAAASGLRQAHTVANAIRAIWDG